MEAYIVHTTVYAFASTGLSSIFLYLIVFSFLLFFFFFVVEILLNASHRSSKVVHSLDLVLPSLLLGGREGAVERKEATLKRRGDL